MRSRQADASIQNRYMRHYRLQILDDAKLLELLDRAERRAFDLHEEAQRRGLR